ncbi:MAG: hypothetical protein RR891_04825 [Clostridium sp.]|uniref:hypothetical protein n=1 Tax=Clostridium sp. TaxID=1506 RepID=UPI00303CEED7
MLSIKPNRGAGKRSKKAIEDKLIEAVMKKVEKINIVSSLNNKTQIFNDVFKWCLSQGRRILYIINEDKESFDISKVISNEFLIQYIDNKNHAVTNGKINVCTHNVAIYLEEKFDVVIYDEVNSRPRYSKDAIVRVLNCNCNNYGTMISYSMEEAFKNELTLYNLRKDKQVPIVEPRIITTRMNVAEEIPMVVYEYLKWSINTNKKVVIYVPDDERVDKIYGYLKNISNKLTKNIFSEKLKSLDRKDVSRFLLSECGILVTDNFKENFRGVHPLNVMLFFADDINFNYKDLVYISSKINRLSMAQREEVIFICNSETKHMDICRNVLRELNKRAWEEGYLKL